MQVKTKLQLFFLCEISETMPLSRCLRHSPRKEELLEGWIWVDGDFWLVNLCFLIVHQYLDVMWDMGNSINECNCLNTGNVPEKPKCWKCLTWFEVLTSSVAWVSENIKEVQIQKHIFLARFILVVEDISSAQDAECCEYCFSIPKAVHTVFR